jgi:hypothetical protein
MNEEVMARRPEEVSRVEEGLRRVLGSVSAADSKATGVFAMDVAMLGGLAAAAPKHFFLSFQWSTIICSAVLLGFSVISLSLATIPRLAGPESLLYFGGIAAYTPDDFRTRVLGCGDEDYLHDLIRQVHQNSKIAATKFGHIKRATLLIYIAVPFWVAAVFLSYWKD